MVSEALSAQREGSIPYGVHQVASKAEHGDHKISWSLFYFKEENMEEIVEVSAETVNKLYKGMRLLVIGCPSHPEYRANSKPSYPLSETCNCQLLFNFAEACRKEGIL